MCLCGRRGAYVHMYSKYEVSMSNHVPGEVCTDDAKDDDGQSIIVYGSLADKPNEPKSQNELTTEMIEEADFSQNWCYFRINGGKLT